MLSRALLALTLLFVGSAVFAQEQPSVSALLPMEELLKLRDPFKKLPGIFQRGLKRAKTDLELYPIEDFKMIGMVSGPTRPKAMILAPNGKTYFISPNDRIGVQEGKVTRITSEEVQVQERVVNLLGQEERVMARILMSGAIQGVGAGGVIEGGEDSDAEQVPAPQPTPPMMQAPATQPQALAPASENGAQN